MRFITAIFIQLILVFFVSAQEVTIDQKTAQELYQAVQERNELRKVVQAQNEVISAKDKVIAEMEAAKLTPCATALNSAEKLIAVVPFGDPNDTKAMIATRKELLKLKKLLIVNSVKAQCDWKETEPIWKSLLKIAPVAAAVLLK